MDGFYQDIIRDPTTVVYPSCLNTTTTSPTTVYMAFNQAESITTTAFPPHESCYMYSPSSIRPSDTIIGVTIYTPIGYSFRIVLYQVGNMVNSPIGNLSSYKRDLFDGVFLTNYILGR